MYTGLKGLPYRLTVNELTRKSNYTQLYESFKVSYLESTERVKKKQVVRDFNCYRHDTELTHRQIKFIQSKPLIKDGLQDEFVDTFRRVEL